MENMVDGVFQVQNAIFTHTFNIFFEKEFIRYRTKIFTNNHKYIQEYKKFFFLSHWQDNL